MRQNPFEVKFLCGALLTRQPGADHPSQHTQDLAGCEKCSPLISCTCRSDVWQDCTGLHLSFRDEFARLESIHMNSTVDTMWPTMHKGPLHKPLQRSPPPPCLLMRLKCWTKSNQHPFLRLFGTGLSPLPCKCHTHARYLDQKLFDAYFC